VLADLDAVERALTERLAKTKVGDPRAEDTRMGALVSISQRDDVRARIAELEAAGARIVGGDPNAEPPVAGGAFLPPVLLRTDDPWANAAVHDCEPFGPVSTIMPYKDLGDAVALANRGKGSAVLAGALVPFLGPRAFILLNALAAVLSLFTVR
jgi:oxepin-CoA hydrolase/3-oxo-5,6-dehydrosuberyl-CoA semialdehyde dehydrogenase